MDDAQRIERHLRVRASFSSAPSEQNFYTEAADLIARLRVDAERKHAALLNLIAALPDTRRMLIAREDAVEATAPMRAVEPAQPAAGEEL